MADRIELLAAELNTVSRELALDAENPLDTEEATFVITEAGSLASSLRAFAHRIRTGDFKPEPVYREEMIARGLPW